MSRLLDTILINSRVAERDAEVQLGRTIEAIESSGSSPEDAKVRAKEILGIGEKDLIQLEFNGKMKEQNTQLKSFMSLSNAVSKAEESGLIEEEDLKPLKEAELKMAKVIAVKLDCEVEDLYSEDDNE
jgi:hypothetical protein